MMSRFNGVDAVLRAMRTFRNDAEIQRLAIGCLYNFTFDNDWNRRRELVERNAMLDVFRALVAPVYTVQTQKFGILLLGRLCDVAEPQFFHGLVELGAMEAVVKIVKNAQDRGRAGPDRQAVLSACRKLMSMLIV
jgi:hypothetical protein